ncbi:hypothetical protein ACM4MJ_004147, partial [Cronobacter turicensis]|nr:hypothetical protein [Cronobacter turicensis]
KKQPYIRKIECVKVSDDAVTLVYVRYFPGKIHVCYRDPTLPFFGSQEWRRGIIAAWSQKTDDYCNEGIIA